MTLQNILVNTIHWSSIATSLIFYSQRRSEVKTSWGTVVVVVGAVRGGEGVGVGVVVVVQLQTY